MRTYTHICDCGTEFDNCVSPEGALAMRPCKGDCGHRVCDRCERLGLCAACVVVKAAGIFAANADDLQEALEQYYEAGINTREALEGRRLWRSARVAELLAVAQ